MKNAHFAIPEIYGESLSYYDLLRKLVKAMNIVIENYDTIPDQIAEAVANLDASQLFSAVLDQIIDSIATDNTKSTNAVKVYKKHDLLYATFNETVNLYESLIDFTEGTETKLIIGTNIREVDISELFIELRKLIDDEAQTREQGDTALQTNINNEAQARSQADTTLQRNIDNETQARSQADTTLQRNIDNETQARSQADTTLQRNIDNVTIKDDLLWTNSSPTSNFEPQTISLDLSKYKLISIYYFYENNGRYKKQAFFNNAIINDAWLDFLLDTSNYSCRLINSIKGNEIIFGSGLHNGSENNSYCIPYQIYGVR